METILVDQWLLHGREKMARVWKNCNQPEQEIIRIIEMNDKIDIIDIIENLK